MSELADLVRRGVTLARTGARPDLVERLLQTEARLADPSIRVMVVGEFKQGKSKLINALVNAPACPVGDDIATAIPTTVGYGDLPSAAIIIAGAPGQPTRREPVALEEIASHVSGGPDARADVVAAEVSLPRQVLADGLCFVDSPGVGGLNSVNALATLTALPTADAMLLVSDASQEYTAPEMQFLNHALRISPNVACVVSKTDLYPQWRQVAGLDRGHLDRVRPGIPLFPVSADLRLLASQRQDQELNSESGIPDLIAYLRTTIVGNYARVQQRAVSQDIVSVTEHLALALQTELNALVDPQGTPAMVAAMEAAKTRTAELRQRSARWQATLNDGMGDLIADLEYDLRDRMRAVQRDAEISIDEGDPGKVWDEFTDWMEQRVAAAISDTFVWTNERAQWLSAQVADHFAKDEVPLPVFRADDTDTLLEPVDFMPELEEGRMNPLEKLLVGLRGSYGGVLMVGLITGILGMALINPFSIAAGVLIGAKVYRDDRNTRLKRRRADAKALVRKQVDEVVFHVGKQLKDRLRMVQRATRDHFSGIAEEYQRSLADSLAAVTRTAAAPADRDQRIAAIRSRLAEVDALRGRARELGRVPRAAVVPPPIPAVKTAPVLHVEAPVDLPPAAPAPRSLFLVPEPGSPIPAPVAAVKR